MRRAERAVYFIGAAAAAGVLQDLPWDAGHGAQAPLMLSMSLIGVLGNASALHRFASLARALRRGAQEGQHAGP